MFDSAKLKQLHSARLRVPDCMHLGYLEPSRSKQGDPVFLNTQDPFAMVTVGVQGTGKTHTVREHPHCSAVSPALLADRLTR